MPRMYLCKYNAIDSITVILVLLFGINFVHQYLKRDSGLQRFTGYDTS